MPKPLAYFNSRKAKVNADVNRGLRNGISNHGEWGWQIRVFLSEEKCKCFSGSADGYFNTSGRMNMARPISSLEICSILKRCGLENASSVLPLRPWYQFICIDGLMHK